jgi:hypothetical protein
MAYTLQLRQLPDIKMRIPLIVGLVIQDEGLKEQKDYMYVLLFEMLLRRLFSGIPNKPHPREIKPCQYQLTINDSISRNLNYQDDDQSAFLFEATQIVTLPHSLTLSLKTPGSTFSCTFKEPIQDQKVTFIGNCNATI